MEEVVPLLAPMALRTRERSKREGKKEIRTSSRGIEVRASMRDWKVDLRSLERLVVLVCGGVDGEDWR